MGNRAVITTAPFKTGNVGIYVHWNGGPESIEGFMIACRELGYRTPDGDAAYAIARLTQAIGCFFGGTASIGVGLNKELDCNNGDNGVYLIGGNWEVVGRKYGRTTPGDLDPDKSKSIALDTIAKVKACEATNP